MSAIKEISNACEGWDVACEMLAANVPLSEVYARVIALGEVIDSLSPESTRVVDCDAHSDAPTLAPGK